MQSRERMDSAAVTERNRSKGTSELLQMKEWIDKQTYEENWLYVKKI
ncbi:hypothetical protein ACEQPO_10260 [Bacillus sp. SL00103]